MVFSGTQHGILWAKQYLEKSILNRKVANAKFPADISFISLSQLSTLRHLSPQKLFFFGQESSTLILQEHYHVYSSPLTKTLHTNVLPILVGLVS